MVPLTTESEGCLKGSLDQRRECCGESDVILKGCTENLGGEYVPIDHPQDESPEGCYQRSWDSEEGKIVCDVIGTGDYKNCTADMCNHECPDGCWHGKNAHSNCMNNKTKLKSYCNNQSSPAPGGGDGNFGPAGMKNGSTPPAPCSSSDVLNCDITRCHWDNKSSTCMDGAALNFFQTVEGRIILVCAILAVIALLVIAMRYYMAK